MVTSDTAKFRLKSVTEMAPFSKSESRIIRSRPSASILSYDYRARYKETQAKYKKNENILMRLYYTEAIL
jgi:hypothetical protein